MSQDFLSQEEVDALLKGVNSESPNLPKKTDYGVMNPDAIRKMVLDAFETINAEAQMRQDQIDARNRRPQAKDSVSEEDWAAAMAEHQLNVDEEYDIVISSEMADLIFEMGKVYFAYQGPVDRDIVEDYRKWRNLMKFVGKL